MNRMSFEEFAKQAQLVAVSENCYDIVSATKVNEVLTEIEKDHGQGFVYTIVGNEWATVANGWAIVDRLAYLVGVKEVDLSDTEVIAYRPSVYSWFDVSYSARRGEIYVYNKAGQQVFSIVEDLPTEDILNDSDENYGLKSWVYENYTCELNEICEELERVGIEEENQTKTVEEKLEKANENIEALIVTVVAKRRDDLTNGHCPPKDEPINCEKVRCYECKVAYLQNLTEELKVKYKVA